MSVYPSGKVYPPIKLSMLEVDADKDFSGASLYGLKVLEVQGLLMGRQLEYVDQDVDLKLGAPVRAPTAPPLKLLTKNEVMFNMGGNAYNLVSDDGYLGVKYASAGSYPAHVTASAYADRVLRARCYLISQGDGIAFRVQSDGSHYVATIYPAASTADFQIQKWVRTATGWSYSAIAYEAVDLSAGTYDLVAYALGSTLKASRDGGQTYPLVATDTSFPSGYFGFRCSNAGCWFRPISFGAPSSPSPRPIAYFEVPVIGSGTEDDPFRAQMPEEIVTDPKLGKRNLLGLTHSSLIKTDRAAGKPTEYVAIVRVFDQPDRDPALRPIPACLGALRAMRGVRELTRDEAIRRAKQIDPDLTDVDLLPIRATDPNFKQVLRDYIAHKESMGVKRELIDDKLMEMYIQEEKGW